MRPTAQVQGCCRGIWPGNDAEIQSKSAGVCARARARVCACAGVRACVCVCVSPPVRLARSGRIWLATHTRLPKYNRATVATRKWACAVMAGSQSKFDFSVGLNVTFESMEGYNKVHNFDVTN